MSATVGRARLASENSEALVGRASWPIDGLPVPASIFAGDTLIDANRSWWDAAWSSADGASRPWSSAVVADDRDALLERISAGDEREPSPIRMVDGSVLQVQIRRLRRSDASPVLVTLLPFVAAGTGATDSLTGVLDGPAFSEVVRRRLGAQAQGCTAVLFADLDRFKQVNDRHGHLVGNEVLIAVISRIRSVTSAQDVVGRLGGDEFGVLLVRGAQDDVVAVADAVVEAVGRPMVIGRQEVRVTVSVGVAVADERDGSSRAVVDRADRAMYRAKLEGRSRKQIFEPAVDVDPDLVHQARLTAALAVQDLERAAHAVLELWKEAMGRKDLAATAALASESHRIRRAVEELRRRRTLAEEDDVGDGVGHRGGARAARG